MTLRTNLLSAVAAAAANYGRERWRLARPDDYGAFQLAVRAVAPSYSPTQHKRLTQLLWAEWADEQQRVEDLVAEPDDGDEIDAAYAEIEARRDADWGGR